MIIKTYYQGGHIVVFDTDHMTEGLPQKGNLLTNYSIDLDDVNGESIWLSSYYYEAAEHYKGTVGPKGLPVARRRDGWSFLLVDAEDIKTLNRVTVDDETVLMRVAGALVDVTALHWAFDVADDIAPMAIAAHAHLAATLSRCNGADVELEACNLMGFPYDAFHAIRGISYDGNDSGGRDAVRDLF